MRNGTSANYDAIVIGSGMGALAFAAIMSRLARKRVLILERHFKPGGFTHSFRRPGGWEWDVGVHYVGGMAPGSTGRNLFDFITAGKVDWNAMPADYEHIQYPGFRFNIPKGQGNFAAALIERFPQEEAAIQSYFRDLKSVEAWVIRRFTADFMPAPVAAGLRCFNRLTSGLALTTTADYLHSRFLDPQLPALLASQWGDYGLPPSQSAFAIHALIATHYLDGAFYPEGGASTIAGAATNIIRAEGGDVLVNHEVQSILFENGRASGVEVRRNQGRPGDVVRFHAPVIVSDAGAVSTFNKLLPRSVPVPFRAELNALASQTPSVATLYIGFKEDPRQLGFLGENHWIFDSLDHDQMALNSKDLLAGKAHMIYLSFPSLKNRGACRHTAEIIAPLSYDALQAFGNLPWRRRGPAYEQMKHNIAQGMLALAERYHPGFSNLIEFQEVSTPLTIEHFTAHLGGGLYGVPPTPERFRKRWLAPRTHVPGLFLTGADAGTLGIMGALMAGVATASQLLGPFGFFRIMAAASRHGGCDPAPVRSSARAIPGGA